MAGTTPTPMLELRDIHLPEPISWWPLAPGWWLLLGFVVLIIIAALLYQRYQKKQALKKQVMTEFEYICRQYEEEKNSTVLVQSLSILLRRTCISFYPRSEAAGLTGETWLRFLNDTGDENAFTSEHGKLIASAPYLSENSKLDIDTEKLIQLCGRWLKVQPNKKHNRAGTGS